MVQDLEDTDITISDIQIQGQTKTLYLESKPIAHFCPSCGYKMHSRGVKNRKINHPILQDNYKLVKLKAKKSNILLRNSPRTETIYKNYIACKISSCFSEILIVLFISKPIPPSRFFPLHTKIATEHIKVNNHRIVMRRSQRILISLFFPRHTQPFCTNCRIFYGYIHKLII